MMLCHFLRDCFKTTLCGVFFVHLLPTLFTDKMNSDSAAALLDVVSRMESLTTEVEEEESYPIVVTSKPPPSPPQQMTERMDWADFSRKMNAVARFCAFLAANGGGVDGNNRYGDEVSVSVQGSSKIAQKPLVLVWSCPGLAPRDPDLPLPTTTAGQLDNRHHEVILRDHFDSFITVIRKTCYSWKCTLYSRLEDLILGPTICRHRSRRLPRPHQHSGAIYSYSRYDNRNYRRQRRHRPRRCRESFACEQTVLTD